jgi:hypothetical protein
MQVIITGDPSIVNEVANYANFRGLEVKSSEDVTTQQTPSLISLSAKAELETLSYLGRNATLSRGLRNNNPGNIRINDSNAWRGKIHRSENTDGEFEQFETFRYGVRAMIRLLKNYVKGGHDTVEKIISRYAPPSENHSDQYISWVTDKIGYPKDSVISLMDQSLLLRLTQAIAHYETGKENCVTTEMFTHAESLN